MCAAQVICEVYATQTSVHVAPHIMLSLILYKMVDEARDVSCGGSLAKQAMQLSIPGLLLDTQECASVGTPWSPPCLTPRSALPWELPGRLPA